jgi:DNA-binding GntR family transcriptional regulator
MSTRRGTEDSALDRAVDAIVRGIREGRYVSGQRLVEADLIEELGVSRSSVREALRRLEAQGLIETEPHRGARVRRLSANDVREIYEVRAVVEPEAARLAALRIDEPGNRKTLKQSLKALQADAVKGEILAYIDENARFHDTILTLSGNSQLAGLIDMMRLQTLRFTLGRYVNGANAAIEKSRSEHELVADRILAGDAEGARVAMRAHIEAMGKVTLEAALAVEARSS